MNMLASGFENIINGVFANWQMLLFAVAAVLLLLTILFRKFKLTAIILAAVAAAIGAVLIADLIVEAVKWDLPDLVAFLVKWVPTVLFTVTVLLATLLGVLRGLRKSLILLAHEAGIAVVCIIAYAVLINIPAVDGFVLKVVNFFMGGSGSLEKALGVGAECKSIRQVFVEWLPTVIKGDFSIMLGESKAYIFTLADLMYHVAFALLLYIVFLIFDFILYIIYHCCYSERKYKAAIAQKYTENKVDRRYSKHCVGGGVVGLVRGVAIGLLSLSFLGTAFYIAAGRGEGKLKDFDFGDNRYNEYYSVYRSIESYGTYGIFKVLNSISSGDDVPYYLFAADLVFSGELNDEEFGVTDNVVFREELSAYTDFARDTMALLLKYGGEEIKPLIKGEATSSAFDTVLNVMKGEDFRTEFNNLISEFDTKTYIINFAMSFVNSAIANIDSMSFKGALSADNKEILKILFTKGHLSEIIPDEKLMADSVSGTDIQFVQPYLNISKLADKKDIQTVFNLVLDVLGTKLSTTDDVLNLVGDVLPQLKKISLFDTDNAEETDPVLGRLYCYAANRYLTEEGAEGVWYTDIYAEKIEWVAEINSLIDVADASLNLYKNISAYKKPIDALIAIFDKNNPAYVENIAYYGNISKSVLKSRILGKTLATSKIYSIIEKGLGGLFDGIYIPRGIVYESTFDKNGNLLSAGEMYNVLYGVGALGENSNLLEMLKNFDKDKDTDAFLTALSEVISYKDENGKMISDHIVDSYLLRSVISAALINYGAEYAYVPDAARETYEGAAVKFIKKSELKALFDSLPELVEFIRPVLLDENADMSQALAEFVEKETFKNLLNGSTVFEGTVAMHLVKALEGDETVIISKALKTDFNGWVSEKGRQGELKNLLSALETAQIEVGDLVSGTFDSNKIKDSLAVLNEQDLQICLKSDVLHYTVSNYLTDGATHFGSFKLIVPTASQTTLSDDVLASLVKKSEIENVLRLINEFGLSDESNVSSVLAKLVKNREMLAKSRVLAASVVFSMTDNPEINSTLKLPAKFAEAATEEKLLKFNSNNPWTTEITRLIDALDEIMGISSSENFVFDESSLSESLSAFLKDMNGKSSINGNVSRLTVCYSSEVVRNNITVRLDELLEGSVDKNMLYGAKSGDYYTERELESLSNVLNIFGIDVMNIKADELTAKIKSEVLNLNEPAEGFSGSKLNVVYPSVIFSGILSSELDDVLLNSVDEEGEPFPMIDKKVLYQIKAGSLRYREDLVANLINSVRSFGIDEFDRISELDINDVKSNIENIDGICASLIMRGIFTKQIQSNNTLGADHPLAYEENIKIIKTNEIKSIVNLVDKIDDVEETYFDTVALADIRENLFYGDRTVKSYLILSAVSVCIKDNVNLIVNKALVDGFGCVDREEVWALCGAFIAMFGEDASIYSLKNTGFEYPTVEQRVHAVASEIVRAKLTQQIIQQNKGEYCASSKNLSLFTDMRGVTQSVISKYEMNSVFAVIDSCAGNGFTVPSITISSLVSYYGRDPYIIDMMFDSDIIRYKVCDCIVDAYGAESVGATTEQAIVLADLQLKDKYSVDINSVKDLIAGLN